MMAVPPSLASTWMPILSLEVWHPALCSDSFRDHTNLALIDRILVSLVHLNDYTAPMAIF
jgi:hypothetical protein